MILVIAMSKPEAYYEGAMPARFIGRFERMTAHPVVIAHYSMVRPEWLTAYPIRAVFIEGFGYPWPEFQVRKAVGLWDFLHEVEVPVLGACGGHQLIDFVFTKDFRTTKSLPDQLVRRLRPGEPDLYPAAYPGYLTELGIFPVRIVKRDPLFRGLPRTMMLSLAHSAEVRKLPPGFELLATNDNCRIQAMRHKKRPIYGTQFHAENWTPPYLHGERLMANFFRIAGLDAPP